MITAAPVSAGSDRIFVRSLLVALLTVAGIGGVSAQSAPPPPSATTQQPPFTVSGWSYERRGSDVHMFRCAQSSCGAGSKVSYRFYTGGKQMTLDQFREGQEQIIKALEQRTPGQRITLLGVDGDKGTAPRMFKARRLTVTPNGANEYQVSGLLFGGQGGSASLISSARDEKASNDNYARFVAAVKLVLAPKTR
ncbi:hypothetical protein [Bradyrhizobium oropedii]|uniref:hypothetical protein n=1 Tax=Bradyrhizobium oropedii TaxID=1571201 RepID=UPI001E3FFCD8|nr:hypothetical protein [Bradyrhizobium oropedii]